PVPEEEEVVLALALFEDGREQRRLRPEVVQKPRLGDPGVLGDVRDGHLVEADGGDVRGRDLEQTIPRALAVAPPARVLGRALVVRGERHGRTSLPGLLGRGKATGRGGGRRCAGRRGPGPADR